jgi:hypothetical protein
MDSQYDPGESEADEPAAADLVALASAGAWADGQAPYLVRGAYLRCTYGSHLRRLNLPKGHGYFIGKDPLMNAMDCVPGEGFGNIPPFGVCQAPAGPKGVGSVLLKAEKNNPITGEPYKDAKGNIIKMDDTVKGPPCTAVFVESWQNPHQETLIGAAGETPHEAITPD